MKTFLPYYFEHLKRCFLQKAGIERITPSDCRHLSDLVNRQTRRYISETTLKRIFGFAHSKFNPSLFTLNVLSDYCGYNGWGDFCANFQADTGPGQQNDWDLLAVRANRISQHTLNLVKSKSGIPFNKTIPRRFMDEHMRFFMDGDYTATVVSAPADQGKTIALAHWVEKQVAGNAENHNHDIILYFGDNLVQYTLLSGNGILDWLLALLGIYEDRQLEVLNAHRSDGQNLYLVIDGIDDSMIRNGQFNLFGQLADIVALYQKYSWLKLVVSMRSSTWVNNRHLIRDMSPWFTGFMGGPNNAVNVPLLDRAEILDLTTRLGGGEGVLQSGYVEDLAYPLCIQYHWQNNPEKLSMGLMSSISLYDAVCSYFHERIYRNKYNEDILCLLHHLGEHIDVSDRNHTIDRLKVHHLIREYDRAYRELLSLGFLEEFNESDGLQYISYVRISHLHMAAHLMARKLLSDNEHRFDSMLVSRFNSGYEQCDYKLLVIKWCIYISVSSNIPCSFELLQAVNLNISEHSRLIVFLAELLKKHRAGQAAWIGPINREWNANLNYFFGLQFIHKGYEQALTTMMSFRLFEGHQVIVRCCLAVIAIFQLDIRKLEEHIAHLKSGHAGDFMDFPLNPLTCLETIYYNLKFGIVKTEALEMLTRFYFNPPGRQKTYPGNFDEILYLLGLYTLTICRNGKKTLRFLRVTDRLHPSGSPGYVFLCRIIAAEANLSIGRKKEALEIFGELSAGYPANERTYTSFMKISYHALKLKLDNLQGTPQYGQINSLIRLCDDLSYKLTKVQSLAFLLHRNDTFFRKDPKLFNQLHIDLLKTARSGGCRAESLLGQP